LIEGYCGENTTTMRYGYYNCRNLKTAVCGNSVIDMYGAYDTCVNLTGKAACGPSVTNMGQAYINCGNLETAACGNNVINMY
jgi:hypothetical protein